MGGHWSRRQVLRQMGAAGVAGVGLGAVHGTAFGSGSNEKLNIAFVGCGGQGGENVDRLIG